MVKPSPPVGSFGPRRTQVPSGYHTHAIDDETSQPLFGVGTTGVAEITGTVTTDNTALIELLNLLKNYGIGGTVTVIPPSGGESGGTTPSGPAGGDLSGIYPNPQIATGVIVPNDIATAYKDGTAATLSLRTLGTGAQQAAPGSHLHTAGPMETWESISSADVSLTGSAWTALPVSMTIPSTGTTNKFLVSFSAEIRHEIGNADEQVEIELRIDGSPVGSSIIEAGLPIVPTKQTLSQIILVTGLTGGNRLFQLWGRNSYSKGIWKVLAGEQTHFVIVRLSAPVAGVVSGGGGGEVEHYKHTQDVAASTWTISHNLGFRPNVTVRVNMGQPTLTEVFGDIDHPDDNTVSIVFNTSVTGEAYLS